MKIVQIFAILLLLTSAIFSQLTLEDSLQLEMEKIEASFNYTSGTIILGDGFATLKVPEGYKFLDKEQAQFVLTQLWGNPEDSTTLGLLLPDSTSPIADNFSYAIELSYEEDGYISDEDANDIDYDEMLEELKSDEIEQNKLRQESGFPSINIVGWATTPYYNSELKKLYWAKEFHFEGDEINTLNYNILSLGRKGHFTLNVIAEMTQYEQVENDLPLFLECVSFNKGYRYEEFDPEYDKLAAYGVGSLVAGKILAKVGFWALIAKFWKIIAVGIGGLSLAVKKFLKRNKENTTSV